MRKATKKDIVISKEEGSVEAWRNESEDGTVVEHLPGLTCPSCDGGLVEQSPNSFVRCEDCQGKGLLK